VANPASNSGSGSSSCLKYGCERGAELFGALQGAAERGVQIRFLQDNTTNALGERDTQKILFAPLGWMNVVCGVDLDRGGGGG